MKHLNDIVAYWKSVEWLRVHIFLVRLDSDFKQFRGEILHKELVLDLKECYSMFCKEAAHQSTLGDSKNLEASIMVVRNRSTTNWLDRTMSNHPKTTIGTNKSTFKCTHYNKTRHIKSGFKLVWYQNGGIIVVIHKKKGNSKNNSTTVVAKTKLKDDVVERASVLVIVANNSGKVFIISTPVTNSALIIDSRASNHMTFDFRHISIV